MENKAHALAAGAFLLAVSALLAALAFWLSRDGAVRNSFELISREAISGLQPQAAVRFKGVPVGKVTAIGFDPRQPGQVLIRIAVDESAPITRSSYATLAYQGITGLAFVQLDDTGESREPLASSDGEPPRIPLRIGFMGRLTEQGAQVLGQVEEATRRLNQLLAPQNQQALVAALQQTGAAAEGVRLLATRIDATLQTQFDPARLSLPQLAQETRQTLQAVQGASQELGRVALRLQESGGVVDRLAQGSDGLVQGVATLNASTLPRLNRLGDEATRSVRQVGAAATTLSDNPSSLLFGGPRFLPGPGEPGFVPPGVRP
jgi:phospholipid/cholesterol/gamma-HCH transport system substrate-binding protein